MKPKCLYIVFGVTFMLATTVLAGKTVIEKVKHPTPMKNPPPVSKGHPLPRLRGVMRGAEMEEENIRQLAQDWNVNLIRYQITRNWDAVGDNRDLKEYNQWIDKQLSNIETVLKHCEKYGIYMVIDLHALPGGRDKKRDMAMFYEKKYADAFVQVWQKIVRRLKDQRMIWAYDLVNEPVHAKTLPEGMDGFRELQIKAAMAIRAIDPERPIMVTSFDWSRPDSFNYLKPIDMPNIIYQAHMYEPLDYTYQKPDKPSMPYPNKGLHKETLREHLQPVRDFQLAYNVPIYIGEFSAVRWAPGADKYLDDVISIFEEYDWDWSYHAYRENPMWDLEFTEDGSKKEKATEPTVRLKVLKKWWARNERAQ